MFRSMTAYSKAENIENGLKVSVEIKSVNGRNLDLNIKSPKSISHKEFQIREILKQNVSRGNLNIYINVEKDSSVAPFFINKDIAKNIYGNLSDLKKDLKIKEPVTLNELMDFQQFFTQKEEEIEDEKIWKLTEQTLRKALFDFIDMREKEGLNLLNDLKERNKTILEIVKKIEVIGVERIPNERERLRQKVAQIFDNDDIDEQRLQLEMILMADKLDISEECVRLYSHLKLLNELFETDKPVGQKIGFLLQEINRETNTIGSKINDATVAHLVVDMKDEIERIREQVLNIE